MKFPHVILALILSVAAAYATTSYVISKNSTNTPRRETAYERVMQTGTIRCGYLLYPKFVERDPNTNVLSGMWVDFMEEIGKQLGLKIEWTEEVGTANAFDGLKTGRYDMVCSALHQTPGRARVTEFTVPIIFMPTYAYVRADDTRFDNAYEKINDPSIRYAYLDGEFSQSLKAEKFPKAQSVSLPNLTDPSQVLLQVAMGKADISATEPSTAEPFLLHNPGKLKRVAGPALRKQATGFDVGVGEEALLNMLNTTIQAMLASGTVEKIADKYTTAPGQFFLPAEPWGASSQPIGEHSGDK
ncbi:MAG: transporter substrate-binding domain-containing protein [Alphaproteobacteria bacterium]|nr:transporter substrate-binding domain-containing protein [Alphaproteobacteria bacterium]